MALKCQWWERVKEDWARARDRRMTVDGLKTARKLIEQGWCQDAYALTADGKEIRGYRDDSSAVAWCVEEAVRRVTLKGPYTGARPTVWSSMAAVTGWAEDVDALNWNDEPGRTKAEVLEAFDQAIARVEKMDLHTIEKPSA